jgi:hypothetical protein
VSEPSRCCDTRARGEVRDDAVDLGGDLPVDRVQLASSADHVEVERAVARGEIGDARAGRRLLRSQRADDGRTQRLAHIVAGRARPQLRQRRAEPRLILRRGGARGRDLLVVGRDLLLGQ